MQRNLILILLLALSSLLYGQNAKLEGRVFDPVNNEPVPFANVIVSGTNTGAITDIDGKFKFTGLEPGYIRLEVSSLGYEKIITKQVLVTNAKTAYLDIELEQIGRAHV